MTETKKKKRPTRWTPILLVKMYRMLRVGVSLLDMCKELNISRQAYYKWRNEHPEIMEMEAIIAKEVGDGDTLPTFMWKSLPPELRALWDKIKEWGAMGASGIAKIEAMLQDEGKRVRQQLFLYALCVERFCPSRAMKRVNLAKGELDRWLAEDWEFAEMCEEISWHKKNWIEHALTKLISEGNSAAIIFANKSLNADRGYNPRTQVEVNHSGAVLHGVLDLEELSQYLSPTAKIELLDAIRKREQALEVKVVPLAPVDAVERQIRDAAVAGSG
jgi:hypothetical protein